MRSRDLKPYEKSIILAVKPIEDDEFQSCFSYKHVATSAAVLFMLLTLTLLVFSSETVFRVTLISGQGLSNLISTNDV